MTSNVNILVYRLFDDTMIVCIFYPIARFSDVQSFIEMFCDNHQQILKNHFQDKLIEKTLIIDDVSIYCYKLQIKSMHKDFWNFRLSCPISKADKLLQLFKEERIKLEIQKEIFKEI